MATLEEDREALLNKLKELGGDSGNTTLRKKLGWEDDRYWQTHASLVDVGRVLRGKGRGGSVSLVGIDDGQIAAIGQVADHALPQADVQAQREHELYEPAAKTIRVGWIRERGFDESVVEVTALPGRKQTGGTWTRPDPKDWPSPASCRARSLACPY